MFGLRLGRKPALDDAFVTALAANAAKPAAERANAFKSTDADNRAGVGVKAEAAQRNAIKGGAEPSGAERLSAG